MTWYYESFKVVPKGWQEWSKLYPTIELRWVLNVVPAGKGKWKIVQGQYSIYLSTLDQEHLDKRFDTWQDAVAEAHELVSTVVLGRTGETWPEAKAWVEANHDARLF